MKSCPSCNSLTVSGPNLVVAASGWSSFCKSCSKPYTVASIWLYGFGLVAAASFVTSVVLCITYRSFAPYLVFVASTFGFSLLVATFAQPLSKSYTPIWQVAAAWVILFAVFSFLVFRGGT